MKNKSFLPSLLIFTGTLVLGFFFSRYLEWWGIVIVTGVLALWIEAGPLRSFLAGFLGAALLWGGMAWYLNTGNEGIMAGRIGELFGGVPAGGLIILTALIGVKTIS